jgi:asparagine synthase (glutamine-hydrolysing)
MCGIAGFVRLDGGAADVDVALQMTRLQAHRGPDDQGLRMFSLATGGSAEVQPGDPRPSAHFEGALGFNRLKVLDLTRCGHQPMTTPDGKVIIGFNGEIYNAFDLRPELEAAGYRFRSRTDTEVILYLYDRYGLDGMLSRLNGMFAIVIVDLRAGELILARDHFGIKPLYWTLAGRSLLFGSEMKSFLAHPDFHAEIAAHNLDEYLAFRFVSGCETLLNRVMHLAPGHYLRLRDGAFSTQQYWSVPDHPEKEGWSDARALAEVDQALQSSVRSQLQSDVKVGCQLSGGVDSSLVAMIARSHFAADMETFSIVFDDAAFSEQRWMTQAAAAARATAHHATLTPQFVADTLDRASWHMDQPLTHPNSLGIWLLAREARPHVTVLLSGEGADEVFGGYSRTYYAGLRPTLAPWLPALRHLPVAGGKVRREIGGEPVEAYINTSRFQSPQQVGELRPDFNLARAMVKRRALFHQGSGSHLDRCLKYEMRTYLVDLLIRQDKMTMAHSVENRVPFLDRPLVELARRLPSHCLVSASATHAVRPSRATKVILKSLARRSFDDAFVYRRKSGFPLPLAQYFADPALVPMMEERVLPSMARRGWIDAAVVRRRWKAGAQASQGDAEALWISIALELWAQQFLDRSHAH